MRNITVLVVKSFSELYVLLGTAVLRTGNTYDFSTSLGQTSERGKTGCELGLQTYTTPIWQDMEE